MTRVTVQVPATSANLGSGYDAFGLALARHNTVGAELLASSEPWRVTVTGEGEGVVSLGVDNRVVSSMRVLFSEAGHPELTAAVTCANRVPLGRGLGSSSAAIVGGLIAANELLERPFGDDELFGMAARIEGHPDNVAAALFGGFTICWAEADGPSTARVDPAAAKGPSLLTSPQSGS